MNLGGTKSWEQTSAVITDTFGKYIKTGIK